MTVGVRAIASFAVKTEVLLNRISHRFIPEPSLGMDRESIALIARITHAGRTLFSPNVARAYKIIGQFRNQMEGGRAPDRAASMESASGPTRNLDSKIHVAGFVRFKF